MPTKQDFESLIAQNARLMASTIRKVCGERHRELVPDIEQEVQLALWKRVRTGEKIEHPVSYIYKVALTTALRLVRKIGTSDVPLEAVPVGDPPAPGSLEALTPVERTTLVKEALSRLEPDASRAVRAYLAGFNHREVAELFGWTESSARHRIYRSIELLAREMRDDDT